jgi:hypothetical protein
MKRKLGFPFSGYCGSLTEPKNHRSKFLNALIKGFLFLRALRYLNQTDTFALILPMAASNSGKPGLVS